MTEEIDTQILGAALYTQNLDQLLEFYTNGLGMVVMREIEFETATEIILGFEKNTSPALMLYQKKNNREKLEPGASRSWGKLVLRTRDAAALAARLSSAGYKPGTIKPNSVNQMEVFWVDDPDGNPLEIVEYSKP